MGSNSLLVCLLIMQSLINLHQLRLKKFILYNYFKKVNAYTSIVWMNNYYFNQSIYNVERYYYNKIWFILHLKHLKNHISPTFHLKDQNLLDFKIIFPLISEKSINNLLIFEGKKF